jgi:hypothetical protein
MWGMRAERGRFSGGGMACVGEWLRGIGGAVKAAFRLRIEVEPICCAKSK